MAFSKFNKFSETLLMNQRQEQSGNRYITTGSNTKSISITISNSTSIDTHPIEQIPSHRL